MKLEIWLTDLEVEPQILLQNGTLRVHLAVSDSLEHLLVSQGTSVPEPLRNHLVQLWAGECPERTFKLVDQSTLVISAEHPNVGYD